MSPIPQSALNKLIELAAYDLQVRAELVKNNELSKFGYHPRMKKVHEDNLVYLKEFLSKYGWPRPSQHGKEAFEAAWFIAIHAIDHKQQMKEALKSIKVLLDEGEEVGYQYASIYDRIEIFEGRNQLYGTQLAPSKQGWYAFDLKDPDKVDDHRASIGLPTLAEKIAEFTNSPEPGFTEEEEEEQKKFEEWLKNSDWRK
jgi:hypothetical protein